MTSIQHTAIILAPYLGVEQDVTRLILKNKTSSASDKLQIKPMMETLIELGVDTRAISLNKYFQISNLEKLRRPDLCFISKLRSHPGENSNVYAMFHQACVLHLKRKGSQIITVYSDHLAFLKEADGELYANILFLSDAIIAPTTTLANHAKLWAPPETSTFIVRDPCLIKEYPFPPFSEQENCRVLWFGSNSNIQYLQSTLPDIVSNSPKNRTFELTFLASAEGIKEIQKTLTSMNLPSQWSFRAITWDYKDQPIQLQRELEKAHITLIPSDPNDHRKNGVSHNRLVDSIQSGCIAVASPLASYKELSRVSLLGSNLSMLFNKAVSNYDRLSTKYTNLRPALLQPFHRKTNKESWKRTITSLLNKSRNP